MFNDPFDLVLISNSPKRVKKQPIYVLATLLAWFPAAEIRAAEWRTITTVEARSSRVYQDIYRESRNPQDALGREFVSVDVSPSLTKNAETEWQTFDCRRGDYFDLWSILGSMPRASPHDGILLKFSFDSLAASHVALGVGFCDSGAIWVNGSLKCHIQGKRDINDKENIIYFESSPGTNLVEILLWKADRRDVIPLNTFEDEWAVKITLAQNKNQRPAIPSETIYLLDTPIAKSFDSLQSSIFFGEEKIVDILNIAGEKVGSAQLDNLGRIRRVERKNPAAEQVPFLGYIRIEDCIEPVLISDDFEEALDSYVRRLVSQSSNFSSPWHYRANHLIRPQFKQQRDRWWARKLVMACAKVAALDSGLPIADFGRHGPRMEFGSYRSSIDGTTQYYQYFKSPTSKTRRKVLIFLQAAPLSPRPFLESPGVADIKDTEQLVKNAAEFEFDVIVPGNVDMDYGGALSRTWVSEAIYHCLTDNYKGQDVEMFLVGTCAAGVASVNLTGVLPTTGLILWSPVVHRQAYRWPLSGDSNLDEAPRSMWMDNKALPPLFKKGTPVFLIYDIDVKGHGDRQGAKLFASALRKEQGMISERWISKPDSVLQWGLRAGASQREWMSWAARLERSRGESASPTSADRKIASGDFFWRDFNLGHDESSLSRQLCDLIRNEIGLYRGTPPRVVDLTSAKLRVKASSRSTVLAKAKEHLKDESALASLDEKSSLLLIFPTGQKNQAELIISTDTTSADIPKIDPWKECFSPVILWALVDRKWVVVAAN